MTNCSNCSKSIEKSWSFCPHCGTHVPKSKVKNLFSVGMEDVFDKMFQEIHEQMFQSFFKPQKHDYKEPIMDNRGKFSAPQVKGFSIKISQDSSTGAPQINVQEMGSSAAKYKQLVPHHHHHKKRPIPKATIEPKTESNKLPGKQLVDIDLSGVKSMDDIDIIEGEESVEIRAYKGDTLYFKILQIEPNQTIQHREFKNSKLHLEIGRE